MTRQIQILTNEESFNIIETVDGVVKKDFDIPYNQVWLSVAEDTLTIQIITKQYSTYVNGLYSWYVVDGAVYGSIDELQSALEEKLFKNPEGGGGAKVNVVDELPEIGNEGEFYVLSDTKEMFVYVDGEYIPTAKDGMKQRILTYSNATNQITDEEGNVMTMEDIKSLVLNTDNFVYMTDDNWVFLLPSLNYFGDAMEFVGTYVLDGYTWTDRVIINSNDEVSEYHLQSEKVENKVSEITDANEESTEMYPSNKAVKEYVATHVEKGMSDDEARVISESLNDLNSRVITLEEKPEPEGRGRIALNYTEEGLKDADGNVKTFAEITEMMETNDVVVTIYQSAILTVYAKSAYTIEWALTTQGEDETGAVITNWVVKIDSNNNVSYDVMNVHEGQGGGESNVVFYYSNWDADYITDKEQVEKPKGDLLDLLKSKDKEVILVVQDYPQRYMRCISYDINENRAIFGYIHENTYLYAEIDENRIRWQNASLAFETMVSDLRDYVDSKIWTGTESELPTTEENGVLYLIHD